MANQPWKTESWQTSPWNFADEVMAEINFPEKIRIHDVTLRDGEQQAGLAFDYDDKIRIAEALAEAGVHRIEAGMPVVSKDDARVVQDLAKRNFGPEIFSFARCMVDDVQRAVDAGVNGVIMEVPVEPASDREGLSLGAGSGRSTCRSSRRSSLMTRGSRSSSSRSTLLAPNSIGSWT